MASARAVAGQNSRAGLFLRLAAAVGVEWYVRRRSPGRVCVFADAEYYWLLAGTICREHFTRSSNGETFPTSHCGRRAIRSSWRAVAPCWETIPWVPGWFRRCSDGHRLAGLPADLQVIGEQELCRASRAFGAAPPGASARGGRLTALHPYLIVMSALLLSEAVFVPWMLLALWGLASSGMRRGMPVRSSGIGPRVA